MGKQRRYCSAYLARRIGRAIDLSTGTDMSTLSGPYSVINAITVVLILSFAIPDITGNEFEHSEPTALIFLTSSVNQSGKEGMTSSNRPYENTSNAVHLRAPWVCPNSNAPGN